MGNEQSAWPVRGFNTVVNICPQGELMVIERLGVFKEFQRPGLFLLNPFVENIAYRVDMRERLLRYPPQKAITRDNVSVEIDGVLYVKFVDAEKAAYGALNPLDAVVELAKSTMRAAVGDLELDDVFHMRKKVNQVVCDAVKAPAANWGLSVLRHEISEVRPDKHIAIAMDKQAAAERLRRERVLEAEGEKTADMLSSEGRKIRLQNESEGNLIKAKNEALAEQSRIITEAEGNAKAILEEAQARSKAMKIMAQVMTEPQGMEAAQMEIAKEYVSMYGKMAQSSNTLMIAEKAADVPMLMLQAMTAVARKTPL